MQEFDDMVNAISKDYVTPHSLGLKMKKIKVQDKEGNVTIKDGNPYNSRFNLFQIITYHPRFNDLFWDEFSMQIFYDGKPFVDHEMTNISIWMEMTYFITPTEETLRRVIVLVARNRSKNKLAEYLDSHKTPETAKTMGWDGVPRLQNVFTKYFGVAPVMCEHEGTQYAIMRALYATLDAPIKQDVVLILFGPQGIRKSSALEALAMKQCWFSDEELDLTSKDCKYAIQGKLIYELAEWSGRGKNIQREKAFYSRKVDRFRPVHGTFQIEVPRRANFAVSANRESLLNDSTGSRRYWGMVCGAYKSDDGWDGEKINVEELAQIAPQLWLEARYYAHQKRQYWLTDYEDKERAKENYIFSSVHPWMYKVKPLANRPIVKIADIMDGMFLRNSERTPKSKTIIEMCLKQLGYRKVRRRISKTREIVWEK